MRHENKVLNNKYVVMYAKMPGVWNKKISKLQRSRGDHAVELFHNFITNKLQIERDTKTKLKHCPSSASWPRLFEIKKTRLFVFQW